MDNDEGGYIFIAIIILTIAFCVGYWAGNSSSGVDNEDSIEIAQCFEDELGERVTVGDGAFDSDVSWHSGTYGPTVSFEDEELSGPVEQVAKVQHCVD